MCDAGGIPGKTRVDELFEACDLNLSGFIERDDLSQLCSDLDLTDEEFDAVFRELDIDGDGKVNKDDFAKGFLSVSNLFSRKRRLSLASDGAAIPSSAAWDRFLIELDIGYYLLTSSSQEQVCELYQSLHTADLPQLLLQFENVILSVIKDIRQQQYENERLERSYKREKEQHSTHLRTLEDEMEAQMQRVESRVRKEEHIKAEHEKDELKNQLQTEISDLQANLKKLQKMEDQLSRQPSDSMKGQLSDLSHENRHLKTSLTEAQTNLVLVKSELATIRQQFQEKCAELENEKEALVEFMKEQDNLARQVHLLHDANKKLHDTNDDLRAALETSRTAHKRSHTGVKFRYSNILLRTTRQLSRQSIKSQNSHNNSEFISDFLDSTHDTKYTDPRSANSSLAEELSMTSDPGKQQLLPYQESCEVESLPDDFADSGHSTLRDGHDIDSEYEPNSIEDDIVAYMPRKRNRRHVREFDSTTESELPESGDDMDIDNLDGELDPDDLDVDHSRPVSTCSRASSKASSYSSGRRQNSVRRRLPAPPIPKPITREPERMYKIVLAGDAAVGKSSFIMRLCKGKFVNNISSTLGVDFQTKILEVDGRVIALQLWDTAGQERFRSIAKSYFRRADGVLLLYDCTYERSFVNVREWMDTVEDGAQKRIPTMLVANKTDLRDEMEGDTSKRVVKTADGLKLAKDFDSLFIETSAKDGENIQEAVIELARILRTNEDLEVQNVGMRLQEIKKKKVPTATLR